MNFAQDKDGTGKPSSSSATLWIGVGVVFGLMALAWTAMFFFASKHRAEDVPLPPQEAR
jgi:flagellar basal body-associated protein FliL